MSKDQKKNSNEMTKLQIYKEKNRNKNYIVDYNDLYMSVQYETYFLKKKIIINCYSLDQISLVAVNKEF